MSVGFSNASESLILSLSSIISFCAVLAPIPGALDISFTSSDSTANLKSSGEIVERIAKAPFGPIPFTLISILNISRSSLVRKP